MAQHWERDPASGDYVMENGAPKQTNSLRIPAYHRLRISRTKWLYAPDNQYGSDFYALKKRKNSSDVTTVENTAARALQPLIDDGRSSEISIEAKVNTRHNVGLQTQITDAQGEPEELNLPGV